MSGPVYATGDLARQTGTKVETIRSYERDGTMPQLARTEGGRRAYTREHLDRLALIRHGRELGFSFEGIRALLRPCGEVDAIARNHLASVRSRIARLQALEEELVRMVDACGRGRVVECRVIQIVTDLSHNYCLPPEHRGTPTDGVLPDEAVEPSKVVRGATREALA